MMDLEVKHLRHFNDALKRELLADMLTRSNPTPDKDVLNRVIVFGNAFLEREQQNPANKDAVIWFDVHFGEPAVVGLTWAYNPHAPFDDLYGVEWFWRLWSEVGGDNDGITTLDRCQEDFAAYTLQHVTPG